MKVDIKALVIIVLLIAAGAFFWLSPSSGLQAAPQTTFTTIEGKQLTPTELKGKPYLVVFWATSCVGCIKEIPHLIDLQKEMQEDGFKVVAVAMSYDELNLIKTMREQKGLNYDIVWDQDGSIAKAFGGVMVTPTNVLINPDGKIAMQKLGEFDVNDLRQRIQAML